MKNILVFMFLVWIFIPVTVSAKENDTFISETAYSACVQFGEEYNICPEILMSIIEKESSGRADAENDGCKGLMQINEKFHADRMGRLGCNNIFDEEQNIHVGADYLSELLEEYEDIYIVLMCYNMGESKANELISLGIYESDYAEWICERSAELEKIHGK